MRGPASRWAPSLAPIRIPQKTRTQWSAVATRPPSLKEFVSVLDPFRSAVSAASCASLEAQRVRDPKPRCEYGPFCADRRPQRNRRRLNRGSGEYRHPSVSEPLLPDLAAVSHADDGLARFGVMPDLSVCARRSPARAVARSAGPTVDRSDPARQSRQRSPRHASLPSHETPRSAHRSSLPARCLAGWS